MGSGPRSEAHKKKSRLAVKRMLRRVAVLGRDHHWVARKLGCRFSTVRRWALGGSPPQGALLQAVIDLDNELRQEANRSTHVNAGKPKAPKEPAQLEAEAAEPVPVAARVAVDSFLRLDLMTLQELLELSAHVNLEIAKKLPEGDTER